MKTVVSNSLVDQLPKQLDYLEGKEHLKQNLSRAAAFLHVGLSYYDLNVISFKSLVI